MTDSALTARRIGRRNRLVVVTPAYFERAGIPSAPGDLFKHQAVVYLQGEGNVWSFAQLLLTGAYDEINEHIFDLRWYSSFQGGL